MRKIPKLPGAPAPVLDMAGPRKPMMPRKKKVKVAPVIDRRAIERVKSCL